MNEEKTKWRFRHIGRHPLIGFWIFMIVASVAWGIFIYIMSAPFPIPSILGIGELRVGLMIALGEICAILTYYGARVGLTEKVVP